MRGEHAFRSRVESGRRWLSTRLSWILGTFAAGFFVLGIGRPAFWLDEVATVQDAGQDLPDLWSFLGRRDVALGPYYLLVHGWLRLGDALGPGPAEWWVRLPSAAAMTVAVVAVADIARRRWGTVSAVTAGISMILLPVASRYAQEARPYAFAIAFAVLAVWVLERADGRRRWWVAYAVVVAMLGLSHVVGLLTLVAHPLFVRSARRLRLRAWLMAVVPGILPAAVVALLAAHTRATVSWIPAPDLGRVLTAYAEIVGGPWYLLVLVVPAVVALAWVRRGGGLTPFVVWFVAPVLLLAVAGVFTPLFSARYLLVCAPALVLLAASATTAWLQPALLGVLALLVAWPQQLAMRAPTGHGPDYRVAARVIAENCPPGAVARSGIATIRALPYYVARAGCPLRWISGPVPAEADRLWIALPDWGTAPPDPGSGGDGFYQVHATTTPGLRLSLWARR